MIPTLEAYPSLKLQNRKSACKNYTGYNINMQVFQPSLRLTQVSQNKGL